MVIHSGALIRRACDGERKRRFADLQYRLLSVGKQPAGVIPAGVPWLPKNDLILRIFLKARSKDTRAAVKRSKRSTRRVSLVQAAGAKRRPRAETVLRGLVHVRLGRLDAVAHLCHNPPFNESLPKPVFELMGAGSAVEGFQRDRAAAQSRRR
jgi:hypothetical protein